jgi:hypothetical protein
MVFCAATTTSLIDEANIIIGAQGEPDGWAFTNVAYDVRAPATMPCNGTAHSQESRRQLHTPSYENPVRSTARTGATVQELAQAQAWVANDEALINAGAPLPAGRLARLVGILEALEESDD